MSDGYSRHDEIEKLFAAVKALSCIGEVLFNRAQVTLDQYRNLDHAGQCHMADQLKDQLSEAMSPWIVKKDPRQSGRR